MCIFYKCVFTLVWKNWGVFYSSDQEIFFSLILYCKSFFFISKETLLYFLYPFYLINLYNFMFWEKRQCDDKNLTKYLFKCNLFKLRRNYIKKPWFPVLVTYFIILIHVMKNNWISFKMIIFIISYVGWIIRKL